MPPSFSFATLGGSQQTLESQPSVHQRIQLPKFPGFSTFIGTAPAHGPGVEDSGVDMQHYRSYGSLDTDHTGRSLDTFGSLCGPLSELGEAEDESAGETPAELSTLVQVHEVAPLQPHDEHQF